MWETNKPQNTSVCHYGKLEPEPSDWICWGLLWSTIEVWTLSFLFSIPSINYLSLFPDNLFLPPLLERLFHVFVQNSLFPWSADFSPCSQPQAVSGTASFSWLPFLSSTLLPSSWTLISSCSPSPGVGQEIHIQILSLGAKVCSYNWWWWSMDLQGMKSIVLVLQRIETRC